jgi:thiamine kinase-like enzyme
MEQKIKRYFESLKPSQLHLSEKIRVTSINKILKGESTIKYVVIANGKKFVVRLNVDLQNKVKIRDEFKALKVVEKLDIGPKAFLKDLSKKFIKYDFLIAEYIEGDTIERQRITKKLIVEVAELFAKMHSIKDSLPINREMSSYAGHLTEVKFQLRYIESKIGKDHTFSKLMRKTVSQLTKKAKLASKNVQSPCHSDVITANIVLHKDGLKLIDFEGFGLMDPVLEIAYSFESFTHRPFTHEERKLFIETYLKLVKDKTFLKRLPLATEVILFGEFLWEVWQYYRITSGDMPKIFSEGKNGKEYIERAGHLFKKAVRAKVILAKSDQLSDVSPFNIET